MKISICIPAVNGYHLEESLKSIFNNKFQDFEVILNDSSKDFYLSDIISKYDAKIIKKHTKSLESRYITVMEASGDKVLLFDETRIMSNVLLEMLHNIRQNLVVIGEREKGANFISLISNMDKITLPKNGNELNPIKNKSIIPRLYSRDVIAEALHNIKSNLDSEIFQNVVGLDLELIYLESYKIDNDIGIIHTPEIIHYGESNIREVIKKYYRYGYTQKLLENTYYKEFSGLSGRMRSDKALGSRIKSIPIIVLRGIPFIFGYISGK